MNEGMVKTYLADAAITKRRIVKFGSADNKAAQASTNSDRFLGVCEGALGAASAGDPVDVIRSGIANVDYGGTITRGDRLTADSNGKAISAEGLSGSKRAVVNGGSAGNITVTGILTTDRLISVIYNPISGGNVTSVTDLTSEFSITAADTINNTGGTATTGGRLTVIYERALALIGIAEVSGVSGDIGKVMIDIRR